jgi:F0F1-type ATP synthase assembly protein I
MSGNPLPSKEQESATRDLARYSGLGLAFAATVGVFAFAGRWLDERLGSSPWLLLVGVFLGFGLGLYSMIKKVPPATRKARSGQKTPPSLTP